MYGLRSLGGTTSSSNYCQLIPLITAMLRPKVFGESWKWLPGPKSQGILLFLRS